LSSELVEVHATLVSIPLAMAIIALALIAFGGVTAAAFVLLGLWGLMATAAPTGWWSWLAGAMPKEGEAGGGLMVAVIQLCIALGSTVGGVLFDASGYRSTFLASAALLLLGAFLAFRTSRMRTGVA
jgi:predicted MFS family arabinose efflux permease